MQKATVTTTLFPCPSVQTRRVPWGTAGEEIPRPPVLRECGLETHATEALHLAATAFRLASSVGKQTKPA